MTWYLTGNKWLDSWIRQASNFQQEIYSEACANSPLKAEEMLEIDKLMIKLNKINERVYKRILKNKKSK